MVQRPQATGSSASLSLGDAIRDAVSKLPPLPGADMTDDVRVVEITASFGGFAGMEILHVTVERGGGPVQATDPQGTTEAP